MAGFKTIIRLLNKMQVLKAILPLFVGLAASQATLTLDNECTFPCQRISLGGECNTVTDCNSE